MKRGLGILSIVFGLLIMLFSPSVTGNVVGSEIEKGIGSIIGLVFVITGIVILLGNKKLEIMVYEDTQRKGKEDISYTMTDPELYLGRTGLVSLGEFRHAMRELGGDRELMDIVRQEYGGELKRIASLGTKQEQEIALKFLGAMDEEFRVEGEEETLRGDYSLSPGERREIQTAFRDWNGQPNKKQRDILSNYEIRYVSDGKKHPRLESSEYPEFKLTVPSTPGDSSRGGKNLANSVASFIESLKRRSNK